MICHYYCNHCITSKTTTSPYLKGIMYFWRNVSGDRSLTQMLVKVGVWMTNMIFIFVRMTCIVTAIAAASWPSESFQIIFNGENALRNLWLNTYNAYNSHCILWLSQQANAIAVESLNNWGNYQLKSIQSKIDWGNYTCTHLHQSSMEKIPRVFQHLEMHLKGEHMT